MGGRSKRPRRGVTAHEMIKEKHTLILVTSERQGGDGREAIGADEASPGMGFRGESHFLRGLMAQESLKQTGMLGWAGTGTEAGGPMGQKPSR